jgi:hypothetical protein
MRISIALLALFAASTVYAETSSVSCTGPLHTVIIQKRQFDVVTDGERVCMIPWGNADHDPLRGLCQYAESADVGKITSLVTTGPRPPAQKRQNGRATGYEGGLAAAPRCASLSNSFVRPGHASLRIEKTLGILFVGVFHSQLPQARAFGRCDVRHMHLWT